MPKFKKKPKLTNRGGFGLHSKLDEDTKKGLVETNPVAAETKTIVARHRISPTLQPLAVSIDGLVLDPNNARLHPERNMEAIKLSLATYGQLKPLVVRRDTNTVIAGNGTLQAARELGWTELAVNYVDMGDGEAAGYGLADNRTSELAKWDVDVIEKLDRIIRESGGPTIGWSKDELEVLRCEWVEDRDDEEESNGKVDKKSLTLKLTKDQRELFERVLDRVRAERFGEDELDDGKCFEIMCLEYLGESEE
jgi:hypothetical protein